MISPVVYQLELPPAWKIFNTFYATLLSPYKEMEEHGINFPKQPPDLIDDHEEYKVEEVLDTRLYVTIRGLLYAKEMTFRKRTA